MDVKPKIRLGDMLVNSGVITAEQLQQGLQAQKQTGRKLGATLIGMGILEETRLIEFLAQQFKLPLIDLAHYKIEEEHFRKLSEVHARRYRALVLAERSGTYVVAMADPTDLNTIDEIERLLSGRLQLAIAREADILRTIDLMYRKSAEIETLAEKLGEEIGENTFDLGRLGNDVAVQDAPVVKLLHSIFEDAVQVRASDIHIEPDDKVLRIRLRVDGMLQEQVMKEARIASAMVLRLKLMANMDIAEKRLPQDGRFFISVRNRHLDVRMATMPVLYGEAVVMRILDQDRPVRWKLDQLGMPADVLTRFRHLFSRPHGLILATGPTGSGKTTSLYAALNELNRPEVKIITVEDPVEYRLPRINQVQINPKIELSFGRVLRTVLRQDPDIVMVGEMRDQETVEIGLRAAMTGHLVFSTLHTNDAMSSAMRLLDMGADGFLVASALRGIVAQRLLRRICVHCTVPAELDAGERVFLRALRGDDAPTALQRGEGCPQCHNTGYFGRIGVYELLTMTPAMASALHRSDAELFMQAARRAPGFKPLVQSALDYAAQGLTTLEEVMRIAESIDDEPERVGGIS